MQIALQVSNGGGRSEFFNPFLLPAPVADAGSDQAALVGNSVTFDGTASRDPDGDALGFSWTLATPAGSLAVLVGDTTGSPTFTPDVPGAYAATLTVTDPFGAASTAGVVVSVTTGEQFLVMDALNLIGTLPADGERRLSRGGGSGPHERGRHVGSVRRKAVSGGIIARSFQ